MRKYTRLLFIILLGGIATIASAAYFQFSGSFGTAHTRGVFHTDSFGNAGTVSFSLGGTAGLDGTTLVGGFTVETIGIVSFGSDAHITPPSSGKVTDLWSVSGTASSRAGAISLDHVYYDPVTKKLAGYGTNHGIGRVPFGDPVIIDSVTGKPRIDTTIASTSIKNTTASTGFEGRVKVLGVIGGNSAFDMFYAAGTRFNASVYNTTLNQMRQNIALLTRNIAISSTPKTVNNAIFVKGNKTYGDADIKTDFPTNTVDSLIIIGGDLIIDTDILEPIVHTHPKAIIVMKDTNTGLGGNIIVRGSVKHIQASIFAEGSLYSGDDLNSLYNDTTAKILTLPENQLYIQGSLISRNTIGGATQSNALCVYDETTCDFTRAIRYDLNYFRLTPPTRNTANPTTRSYPDSSLDTYSLIIERDSRISSDPPPGWSGR